MKKQVIRLTESDLHNIIKESVYQVLNESENLNEDFKDNLKKGAKIGAIAGLMGLGAYDYMSTHKNYSNNDYTDDTEIENTYNRQGYTDDEQYFDDLTNYLNEEGRENYNDYFINGTKEQKRMIKDAVRYGDNVIMSVWDTDRNSMEKLQTKLNGNKTLLIKYQSKYYLIDLSK